MISEHEYVATLLEGSGHNLAPSGGLVTMDEGWAPHVQASLTIPIPPEEVQELLDSREARRVEVSCLATYHALTPAPSQSRTFNLGLRARRIGHRTDTITLTLESDEALLMDDVLLDDEPNVDGFNHQASLRDLIDSVVLSRIGASLEPGTTDTAVTVYSDSRNLLSNPTAQTDTADTQNGDLAGVGRWSAATWSPRGTAFILVGNASVNDTYFTIGGTIGGLRNGMQGGKRYVVRGTFHLDVAMVGTENSRARTITVFTRVGTGAYVSTSVQATNTTGNQDLSLVFDVPEGATEAFIRFYHGHQSTSNAFWHSLRLSEITHAGPIDTTFWDGDTADTSEYAYAWTGVVGSSVATRTALIERAPDSLRWDPGESAWKFIQPIFQAASMRLYCDEQRRWFLVDTSYLAEGQTQIAAGVNATEAVDDISRDSGDWFDAALVRYRWRDSNGAEQIAYDWYAAPGHTKVTTLDVDRPFPGPGLAAYMVARAEGKGRQITVSAVSLYQAQPTQPVVITLPDTPIQTGVIASVQWSLDDDTMTVQSRGLTDTPASSWAFGAPGIAWDDLPAGMDWTEFDWSIL